LDHGRSARAARDGRNLKQETIQIAAKNVVKFKAGAELEGAVN
jgi:DNA-binding protein HU-beta